MDNDERILRYIERNMEEYIEFLKEFVELESPSHENKEASDICCGLIQKKFSDLGFKMERIPQIACGDHLYGELGSGEKGVIFVGHYDTVYPIDAIENMPFRVEDGKAFGPGALDMKGGIVMAYMAIKALKEENRLPKTKIGVFFNSDEESGSFYSKDLIIEKSKGYKAVLVMEPGINDVNSIKVKRYGRGTYTITAHGVAAHSGSNPHLAISAIMELSNQLKKIEKWNEETEGVTFAPVHINGGIPGTCTIPDKAFFTMDVRYETEEMALKIHDKIMNLQPIMTGASIEVQGKIDKPVMVGDKNLFDLAFSAGKRFNLNIVGTTVGGGSDGNFTSSEGIPTLDGLGTTGEFLHNPNEYIHLDHVPPRIATVATLLTNF